MEVDGRTSNDTEHQEDPTVLAARITALKADIIKNLQAAIETVSKYAGGALPENARVLVHRQITSLPQRFRYASMVEQQQNQEGGERQQEEITREGANRVLVLAKEGLDMITQVSGVIDGTIVSAEEWCDRLGSKRKDEGSVLPEAHAALETKLSATFHAELDDLLHVADCVVLCAPYAGRHIITAASLQHFKPGSRFVNVARGSLVDEPALADALEAGLLSSAALDVHAAEPAVHPRLAAMAGTKAFLTCHNAGGTVETHAGFEELSMRNIMAVLAGQAAVTPHFKPGSRFVNVARGSLVDEPALADALEAGLLSSVALDVHAAEPSVHPRLAAMAGSKAFLTCHNAGGTVETHAGFEELSMRNIMAVLAGQAAVTPVNLEHLRG
ncbi:hypothetical protein BN1723_008160 [Verticillium longisporum]|uniref:D-isomer specific 2-hydroxyacid dehydrogenase NAD-binding domain-containing protein n=1 Tax=Verticillium longisporum TaxID=100787 RepID=A0A0G4NQD8_VERLO|nr:hypothetical protein BN1723_008160 [Verticillium longisporum]